MATQQEQDSNLNLNQEIQSLENQLSESLAADNFFNSASGILWTKLVTAEITRLTRDVTSDKYRKDHVGYNNALSDLLAYKNILKRMQVAGSPKRRERLKQKLEESTEE